MSVAEKLTYAEALAGRGGTLAAIVLGSFGVGELVAQRLGYAVPCVLASLALIARSRVAS